MCELEILKILILPMVFISFFFLSSLSGSYGLDLDLQSDDLTWGSDLVILLRSLGYLPDRSRVSEPQVIGRSGPL